MADAASRSMGILTVAELAACGLDRPALAVRARAGHLHRVHNGVYAVGHTGLFTEQRFLAAVKACGTSALLSHFSAAALWDLVEWTGERRIEVTVAGTTPRRHPGIHLHRTIKRWDADTRRHKGVPVTSPARTIVDVAGSLSNRALRRMIRRAQGLGLASHRQICETRIRCGPRAGSKKLAGLLVGGAEPTRSELENVVLDVIIAGGFPRPSINEPMRIDGRTVIPDFRWPELHLVLEADGAAWHENRIAREDDAERQSVLEAAGERVLRVTWDEAIRRPHTLHRRLRAAGAHPLFDK